METETTKLTKVLGILFFLILALYLDIDSFFVKSMGIKFLLISVATLFCVNVGWIGYELYRQMLGEMNERKG